jgi:hypothetical protein
VTLHLAIMGYVAMELAAADRHQELEFHEMKKLVECETMGESSLKVEGIEAVNCAMLALTTCLEA